MKELVNFKKDIGGDGAKAEGAVIVQDGQLKAQASVSYPIIKIVEPVTKVIDKALDKLEALIPGDWDKALLEKVKEEYKEELAKLISEV